jgi:hypothetical protein
MHTFAILRPMDPKSLDSSFASITIKKRKKKKKKTKKKVKQRLEFPTIQSSSVNVFCILCCGCVCVPSFAPANSPTQCRRHLIVLTCKSFLLTFHQSGNIICRLEKMRSRRSVILRFLPCECCWRRLQRDVWLFCGITIVTSLHVYNNRGNCCRKHKASENAAHNGANVGAIVLLSSIGTDNTIVSNHGYGNTSSTIIERCCHSICRSQR